MVLLALAVLSDGACPSRRSSENPSTIGWFFVPSGPSPLIVYARNEPLSLLMRDQVASLLPTSWPTRHPLNHKTLYIRHCINCHHKISGCAVPARSGAWANPRLSVTNRVRTRLTINVAQQRLRGATGVEGTPKRYSVSPKRPASLPKRWRAIRRLKVKGKSKGCDH